MIERLHNILPSLEHLPLEAQEEAATYIEALAEVLQRASMKVTTLSKQQEASDTIWQDPFGAWSDLPETMLDDLEQIRHEQPPTPLLDLP